MSNNDVWTADATLSCLFSICRLFQRVNSIAALHGTLPGRIIPHAVTPVPKEDRCAHHNMLGDAVTKQHRLIETQMET